MLHERIQGLRHVCVAQVPGVRPAHEHRTVVLLRALHETRVLLGKEVGGGGNAPVAIRVVGRPPLQIDQLLDDGVLAGLGHVERRGIAVGLRLFTVVLEARVAIARTRRRGGIHFVEIPEDGGNRGMETVETNPSIHPIGVGPVGLSRNDVEPLPERIR
jgi:hypothetical protein